MKHFLYCFTTIFLLCNTHLAFAQQETKTKKPLFSFFKKKNKPQKVRQKNLVSSFELDTLELVRTIAVADSLDLIASYQFASNVDCGIYEAYILQQQMGKEHCQPTVLPSKKPQCKELSSFMIEDSSRVDLKWLTAGPAYFSSWDSESLKIYGTDLCSFSDSVVIELFCEEDLKGWSIPNNTDRVTSKYGFRWRRWHHGVDLDLVTGDPIYAPFDGIVRVTDYDRGFGRYIVLRHENGLETVYGHLSKIKVKPGQIIKAGQTIGLGGNSGRSTGSHLHFEIRYNGHALDPKVVFDFNTLEIKDRQLVVKPSLYSRMMAFGIGCDHNKRIRRPNPAALYGSRFHRVRSGESLWTISRKYGVSISQICKLSGISRRTVLRPGRKIRVN
jgi:hypothetical protein